MDLNHQIQEIAGRQEFFRLAMTTLWCNAISGDYAEFGCYGATTFRLAYQESRKVNYPTKLWAFDSFEGLPAAENDHPRWRQGGMAMDHASFVAVLDYENIPRDEYVTVPGFYSDTLGPDNPAGPSYCPDLSLAYVDCDLYASAKQVMRFLTPRLKHGMIVALDDYHCWWPEGVAGERMALLELAAEVDEAFNFVPFVQFGWHGQSFFVEARRYMKGLRPRGHF